MLPALLKVRSEEGERRASVDRPRFRMGRSPDDDLVLNSVEVSRHHAEITLQDRHFVIQ